MTKFYIISNCNYESETCNFDELNKVVCEIIDKEIVEIKYHYTNSEIDDETNGLKDYIYKLGQFDMTSRIRTLEVNDVKKFLEVINYHYNYIDNERLILKEINVDERYRKELKRCIDRIGLNELFLITDSGFTIKNI
ncbi:hypothetical protein [Staphylococcus gallinarum]|uniref:hypothetical protein n=1 Tax=Staphylococcus gallinarum TaxID=1293 RepID=UPI001E38AC9A|nr:hypothetical protein [Staphylococcus gallinarum]MCD8845145.1 hypothetical protein [Staphylococcus gallinarum]